MVERTASTPRSAVAGASGSSDDREPLTTGRADTDSTTAALLVDTPLDAVPAVVDAAASKSDEWRSVPPEEKLELLRAVVANTVDAVDEWVALTMEARGVNNDPATAAYDGQGCARAEIYVAGPATFGAYLNGMIAHLEYAAKQRRRGGRGVPPPPIRTRVVGDGKCVATVFPSTLLDMTEAVGLKGELILSGTEPDQVPYDEAAAEGGGVAAVLGAGNFDAPTEVLCQMFLRGRTCVYKPNPVNQAVHPIVRRIMEPLVRQGYLSFVLGGGEVGSALVRHPAVDEVVLTGSIGTYDKVVWGATAEEQARNKKAETPLIDKPVCAELGSVNPWIVVPSPAWTRGTLDWHARHLAYAKCSNNGHTCAAPQVVLTAKDWSRRDEFLERLRYWLAEYGGSAPFYPGSVETYAFYKGLDGAQVMGGGGRPDAFEGQQRPVLMTGVDVTDNVEAQKEILKREAFCPVLAEVPLDFPSAEGDPMAFLRHATDFADRNIFGSLTATVSIDDRTVRQNAAEFDRLLASLPYGVVGVNIWPLFAHSMPTLLWGAFPGRPDSGSGFIGNVGMYRRPEKAVLRAPFRHLGRRVATVMPPKKTEKVYRRLTRYKLRPSFLTQAALLSALFLDL